MMYCKVFRVKGCNGSEIKPLHKLGKKLLPMLLDPHDCFTVADKFLSHI